MIDTNYIGGMKILYASLAFAFLFGMSFASSSLIGTPPVPGPDTTVSDWWKDAVFYEAFVRSFYDSDGDGIGDFQGMIQKLDYLNDGDPNTHSDLGVTGLWLMPMMPSPSYHGYDVTDYRGVHPDYGTMQDFKQFLAEAHSRGIRVIIDYVMNHSSTEHPWHQDARAFSNGKRNFYRWSTSNPGNSGPWGQQVWHNHTSGYYYGLFWGGMPDLNYNQPAVKDSMFAIADFWLNDVGVDGFRLDAVKFIYENGNSLEDLPATFQFWKDFEAHTESVFPGALNVGEAWTSSDKVVKYVEDGGLDFCFEFDLATEIINAVNQGNALSLRAHLNQIDTLYPDHRWGSFLTNHDINRVIETLNKSIGRNKAAASIYLTLPGIPFIYYGEEIGMEGTKPDENIRRPMQWNASAQGGFTTGNPWNSLNSNYVLYNVQNQQGDPASIWEHYRALVQARYGSDALRRGNYLLPRSSHNEVMAFWRASATDTVLVMVNTGASALSQVEIDLTDYTWNSGTATWQNLLTGMGESWPVNANGGLLLDLSGYETKVFSLTQTPVVGASEVEEREITLQLFPNPGTGNVSVLLQEKVGQIYQLSITDAQGQLIRKGVSLRSNETLNLDLNNLASGIYQLKIERNGEVITRQLILQ